MSDVSTTSSVLTDVEQRKATAYGALGVKIHRSELTFQATAQAIILVLNVEQLTDIQQITGYESTLKEARKQLTDLTEERLKIVRDLKPVFDRLKQPEDSVVPAIQAYEARIIELKKKAEVEKQKQRDKDAEYQRIVQFVKNRLSQLDADNRKRIADMCASAYEYALKNNLPAEGISEWLTTTVQPKLGMVEFQSDKPVPTAVHHTEDEVRNLVHENWTYNPSAYVSIYQADLVQKFSDYTTALLNQESALAASALEAERLKKEADQKQITSEVSNALSASAQPLRVETTHKALKQKFEVDMPETIDSARKILAAFFANESLCAPKLRVSKWMSFNVGQASNALGMVKCDDNAFQPDHITFKIIDKL